MDEIKIVGARIHNLKNINVNIKKNKLTLITGVSGSGKSSLAFDTIFDEGLRRYMQAVGYPPRGSDEAPFDMITGLSPTIAVEQRTTRISNPRSTVGTKTVIYNLLRMLYAIEGVLICPICKEPVEKPALECDICGMQVEPLQIKHFSFNEPSGMCLECKGRGYITHFTEDLIVKNPNLNLIEITKAGSGCFADQLHWVEQLGDIFNFDIDTPYKDLPDDIKHLFLYGSDKKLNFRWESKTFSGVLRARKFEGIIPHIERAITSGTSDYRRRKITKHYMKKEICPECDSYRINDRAREIKINDKHIGELAMMTITELIEFLEGLNNSHIKVSEGRGLKNLILKKLKSIVDVGLPYIHLNRELPTLSGGEVSRLALMNHLDSGLDSLVYILDEPTMGLHEIEKNNLIKALDSLKDLGNTIIVVEHDKKLISIADEIIDMGPGAGNEGGEIVYQGNLEGVLKSKRSITGKYLSGELEIPNKKPDERRKISKNNLKITLKDVNTHNLKNVKVDIPLGVMVGIAGVSGSGKSSLITDTLIPLITPYFERQNTNKKIGALEEVENGLEGDLTTSGELIGWQDIDEVIIVNQKPLSRVRTSFPASYIGIWDKIRSLFAKQPLSKRKKYKAGHFSFNSDKGRCPACKGNGYQDMQISLFLPGLSIPCNECKGKRYKPEILDVKYKGKTITEVLDLTVKEALELFKGQTKIASILEILDRIGMGYITLGQSSLTLSGGEAQRVKLAKELGKEKKAHSLFILDEPSTGLHSHDVSKLLTLLEELVEKGNTVIIIEHDLDILSFTDWIVELGPGGGPEGGEIITEGSPEDLKNNPHSILGPYLN
jgi:excinuclease ABC subunit A